MRDHDTILPEYLDMLHLLCTLLCILSIARSAPVHEALSLPMNTASVNASSLGHHDRCDLSKTQSWQAYAFLVEDCFVAVNEFFIKHAVRNPDEIFEFSASQLRAHTRYPRVQTPVVFTHGKYYFLAWLRASRSETAVQNVNLTPYTRILHPRDRHARLVHARPAPW